MAVGTASVFSSIAFAIILAAVIMAASFGAGLKEKNRDDPAYKASVAFASISGVMLFILMGVIIYKATVSKDMGLKGLFRQSPKSVDF